MYNSASSRGAILITQDWVRAEDSVRERVYERYIKKHYRSWLRFADSQGFSVGLKDLVLVTGHDMTQEFAMAAFADNDTTLQISFRAGLPYAAAASISAWGAWETSPAVHRNCGPPGSFRRRPVTPEPAAEDATESETDSTDADAHEDSFAHCIFLRGYRMRARTRLFPPGSIKAAAGPAPLPRGDGSTDSSRVLSNSQDMEDDEIDDTAYSSTPPVSHIWVTCSRVLTCTLGSSSWIPWSLSLTIYLRYVSSS